MGQVPLRLTGRGRIGQPVHKFLAMKGGGMTTGLASMAVRLGRFIAARGMAARGKR
jgi:hypothetical protein